MPCNRDRVGEDNPVSNDTVVGDVTVGHKKAAIADRGLAAPFAAAKIDGGELAKDVVVTNTQCSMFDVPGDLRSTAEHHMRMESGPRSDMGPTVYDGVRTDMDL
jgi:hypothetical protein